MPSSKKIAERVSNSTLIAAGGSAVSAWQDIGRHSAFLSILRTSTGGTYAVEIDWSRDGGATTQTTDTVTTSPGVAAETPARARWFRSRIRNTHGSLAFTAHSTQVSADSAGGSA